MAVILEINSQAIAAQPGCSIFEHAERLGVRVPTSCVKQGKCRECLVEVVQGMELLGPPSPEEKNLRAGFRLSCRARVTGQSGVIKCHTLRRGAMRIEEEAAGLPGAGALRLNPAVTRDGERVLLDGVEIARSAAPLHGIAVDLGTTTVVMRLVNLETGRAAATQSFENPQRFAGSDVMARIQYDTDHRGRLLQRTLIGYLKHAIEEFPCDPSTVYEMTVAGNTTMRDLFFGLNVYSLGQKPYRSLTEHEWREGRRATTSVEARARRLRLPLHPQARVYGLPLIGSHVGSDAAACLLAVDWLNEGRMVALMDIGTNTELLVGNRRRTLAASCPAGPAFEGGGVSCGTPGLEGAIESVEFLDSGGARTRVIGDGRPEGICGSGLVELLGELLRTGRMNSLGRLAGGDSRFVVDAPANIFIEERDISHLAQAKGANVAGLYIVLRAYGVDFHRVERFYLAGAFGRRLNIDAARRIGLIPNLPQERIVQVGNASIEGATIALLSVERRRQLEAFVKTIEHVELETDPEFFEHFVEGCRFVPVETTSYLV